MYIEQSDLSTNNPQAEIKKARIRPTIGLAVFFAVTGLQLLLNPFLYSFEYVYNIISITILSFGTAILFLFSLYLTEELILEDRFRTWKIAIKCLISGAFFGFFYLISLFFDLHTIGPSEGFEFVIGILIGMVYTLFFILVIFITNLIFYKLYNRKINKGVYFLLLAIPIIFSLITIGLKFNDYYDCDFSKNEDCVTAKALSANDDSLCGKNKYANPHQRNGCYFEIGAKIKDLSICEKIVNDGGSGQGMKTSCVANVAFNTNNPSLCDTLKGKGVANSNECYVIFSSESTDATVCDKISDGYAESQCLTNIAINTNNVNYCQNVELQPKFRDYCLADFNRKSKNIGAWGLGISDSDSNGNVESKIKDAQSQEKLYLDTSNWHGAAAGKLRFKYPPDWQWGAILETDGGIVVTSKDKTINLYMYPKISFGRGLETYDAVEKNITIAGKKFVYKDYYVKNGYSKAGYYALSIIKPVDYESISWSSNGSVEFRVKEPLKEKPSILDQIIFTFDF